MKHNNIKSNFISENIRFNAGYYLNDDALNSYKIESNSKKCKPLFEIANVFNPPIFKRQFCQSTDRAVQYCQSSDVTNALEGSEVFINKLQAEKVGSIVKKDQILITGFGTIGNTRLVNELSNGISYANNVCRVEAHNNIPYGYIYAFLTSKYGRAQVNKNASGSVVRYIEAPGIKRTLIPLLEETKQQQIHQLIVQASSLRVEANKLLKQAIDIFNFMSIEYKSGSYKVSKIGINKVNNHKKRFDANYNVVSTNVEEIIERQKIEFITISELSSGIFIGPRSKRNYVSNGIPFLSTSEMQKANPTKTEKFISEKASSDFIVKEGWLLTTRSGTLGDTVFTLPCLNGYAVSEDAIRIVLKEKTRVSNKYLYAFLKSNIGVNSLVSGSYGSVILHLNEEYIGDIKVPILDIEKNKLIDLKIEKYISNLNQAIIKENQAIDLIEKEIDAWQ